MDSAEEGVCAVDLLEEGGGVGDGRRRGWVDEEMITGTGEKSENTISCMGATPHIRLSPMAPAD